jgi:predicted 2-oxoglutarate/Fe(II)-dependent dioxygenase YbiX
VAHGHITCLCYQTLTLLVFPFTKLTELGAVEAMQFTEYTAAQRGHYTWHMDSGSGDLMTRKMSVTVQLSDADDYDGGGLELLFQVGCESCLRARL